MLMCGARHADGARLRATDGRHVIISLASVKMGVGKGRKGGGGGHGGYGQRPVVEWSTMRAGRGGRRRRVGAVLTTRAAI